MKNTICLLVFLFSLTLLSCGGGKNITGSVSFGLRFEQTSAPSSMKAAQSAAAAVDICASYGIDSISGTVYNSSNAVIATGGPWACSAHQGTITNIPAGSNLKVEIKGTVASSVVWQGETTGVTVTADHDTDVGTVTMTYIGSDITPPTISSFTPSGSDVPVTTVITATFSENISAPTINTETFTLYDNSTSGYVNGDVTYDSSTKTATFTPSGNLSYSSNYTAEIMQGAAGVQDLAGWMLQGTSKWNFITEAVPTSAPSVPTGVSATAGNGQVAISWTAATGATSYNIYWSTTSGVTKSTGAPITGATSSYIHTALTNGTTYYYVVTAVNSYGESGESSQVSGTPKGLFGTASNFAVGMNPIFVVVGDLNGDGKPDLAVANHIGNNVSILLGTGTGTFEAATNYIVGMNPWSVAIGDLNGDGNPDLAVANSTSNDVSILLGIGTGSFGAATNFTVGTTPYSVAIGDLNADGNPDLAVANNTSNNVSILLGTGTGSFGVATNFTAETNPISLAIGDLNGDGKQDLVVANNTSNDVSILIGTGTGSFGAATKFVVGINPRSVAIGDLNGDGKPDLAVASYGNGVSILLGTSTDSFEADTNYTVGTNPMSVAIGDLNGDGKLDLAAANYTSNNVSILLNQ